MNSTVQREYKYLIDRAKREGDTRRVKDLEDGLANAWHNHNVAIQKKHKRGNKNA